MKVAVTGSHGLIGSALLARLRADGHQVQPVSRDPASGHLDPAGWAGADAVVHLAGVGLADKRWTTDQKRRIVDSRVDNTRLLSESLAAADRPPAVLVSGSAIGFYGDRGDTELTEASERGGGFLAELCERWEAETAPAEAAGIRVVRIRTGIVLSAAGGALRRLIPLFKAGVGGRLGSGRQYMSWISVDDEVGAISFALAAEDLRGPVNLTAPAPVTNAAFTRALGRAVHRPAVVPVPGFALKLALGSQLAEEALLGGQRVLPAALDAAGYRFAHPDLDAALQHVLA